MDIARAWDTLLRRKTFLVGTLAFSLADEPLRCQPISDHTASLVFVDLISILDSALSEKLQALGLPDRTTLFDRIEVLNKSGALIDAQSLHALRNRRNALAHDLDRIRSHELDDALNKVEAQLQAWQFVSSRPNYIPFYDQSQWRRHETPGDLPYERDFSIGVRNVETWQPVLQYKFIQHVDSPDDPKFGLRVDLKPVGE